MRLTLVSTSPIGPVMGGPAIRYWELAHELAQHHDVTLVAPQLQRQSDLVRLRRYEGSSWYRVLRGQDAVLTQYVTPPLAAATTRHRVRVVLDAYVPMFLETLHNEAEQPRTVRNARACTLLSIQLFSLLLADAVVCASEAQRDLWLGHLMALRRLNADAHHADPSLRTLVDLVPFGLPAEPPRRCGRGPREVYGLPPDAVVALWGGSTGAWFDPETVVRAVCAVRRTDPRLHLVLMGATDPTGTVLTARGRQARAAAEAAGELNRGVHLVDGWVPYEERSSWLLDASVGVSAHVDLAENRFAFRTRVLDYLWAGLPCLLTDGDPLAQAAVQGGYGRALPVSDVAAWTTELTTLLDARARSSLRAGAVRAAATLTWPNAAVALERVLDRLGTVRLPPRRVAAAWAAARYLACGAAGVALGEGAAGLRRRLTSGTPALRPPPKAG